MPSFKNELTYEKLRFPAVSRGNGASRPKDDEGRSYRRGRLESC
jgi:hypothetical protein